MLLKFAPTNIEFWLRRDLSFSFMDSSKFDANLIECIFHLILSFPSTKKKKLYCLHDPLFVLLLLVSLVLDFCVQI